MMRLLTASASPFANKVRMAAELAGVAIEPVPINANDQPEELLAVNPLGKIPCLILDDGRSLFDSRPICRHVDRVSGGKLYPADTDALIDCERYEALCDGIADAAVASIYEKRMRPEDKWHQPWLDRQWAKVTGGLRSAQRDLPDNGRNADIRAVALAAVIGYLDLRFSGQWEEGFDTLRGWNTTFEANHPAVAALKPHG